MFSNLLNLILPPLCLSCDQPVGGDQTLCPECWKQVQFIAPPYCLCCGAPFEVPVEADTLCGECIAYPPHYTNARSAFLYDDASKHLVLRFKHGDRLHPAEAMAQWMKRGNAEILEKADVIVPVPLHRWRLFNRRYNQSALLAQKLGKLCCKAVWSDGLRRVRATPSQGHMNREQRQKNIHNAITLNPKYRGLIAGISVVLVDDVLTTGATVNECARILISEGAATAHVLTLARTKGYRS